MSKFAMLRTPISVEASQPLLRPLCHDHVHAALNPHAVGYVLLHWLRRIDNAPVKVSEELVSIRSTHENFSRCEAHLNEDFVKLQ